MSANYSLVIGCPLSGRDWIIRQWFLHILGAVRNLNEDVDLLFAFVIDEGDPVQEEVNSCLMDLEMPGVCYEVKPYPVSGKEHHWNLFKYEYMAETRNALLELVQRYSPDYFLSLDSDILLHPSAIASMMDAIGDYGAIGSKTYLHRTSKLPNYANIKTNGQLLRPELEGVVPVDVLMAIKLMTPEAYNVPYKSDRRGEDIGWSLNCKERGVSLGFDGRVASKHIMEQSQLFSLDKRVGY